MAEDASVLTAQETFGDDPVTGVGLMADERPRGRAHARGRRRAWKDRALHLMADRVESRDVILEANTRSPGAGVARPAPPRRCWTASAGRTRIAGLADALRELAALPDPVGSVVRRRPLANGLQEDAPGARAHGRGGCDLQGPAERDRGHRRDRREVRRRHAVRGRLCGVRLQPGPRGCPADAPRGRQAARGLRPDRGRLRPGRRQAPDRCPRARWTCSSRAAGAGLIQSRWSQHPTSAIADRDRRGTSTCSWTPPLPRRRATPVVVELPRPTAPPRATPRRTLLLRADAQETGQGGPRRARQGRRAALHVDGPAPPRCCPRARTTSEKATGQDWATEYLDVDSGGEVGWTRGRGNRAHPPLLHGPHRGGRRRRPRQRRRPAAEVSSAAVMVTRPAPGPAGRRPAGTRCGDRGLHAGGLHARRPHRPGGSSHHQVGSPG
ncbi:hypothetical protein QJS66_01770 [Kocuria rhizophila]|nr:hypothetical protein QJS66_01770 [Kocuria rhizophila]